MSVHVRPDPARRIDLPGVGPVPRPLEVGHDVSGLRDVSLRTYRFAAGNVIDGEAEDDEVLILVLSGLVAIDAVEAATGERRSWGPFGRSSPAAGSPEGIYLPPRHSYRLTVHEDAAIAYARAAAAGRLRATRLSWRRSEGRAGEPGPSFRHDLVAGITERLGSSETRLGEGARFEAPIEHDTIVHVTTTAGVVAATTTATTTDTAEERAEHVLEDGHALAVPGGSLLRVVAPREASSYLVLFSAAPRETQRSVAPIASEP